MRSDHHIEVRSPILVGLILVGMGVLFINFPSNRPMGSETWGWVYLALGVVVLIFRSTTFIFRR